MSLPGGCSRFLLSHRVTLSYSNWLTIIFLRYHNTTSKKDRLSPVQKLYGCSVQDTLPAHRRSFAPQWQCRTPTLILQGIPSTLLTKGQVGATRELQPARKSSHTRHQHSDFWKTQHETKNFSFL